MTDQSLTTRFDYNQLDTELRISLKSRADKINERTRRIAADIWENGRDFYEAQQELANHSGGTFLAWVETETGYSKSTVYRMIDVYNNISFPNLGKLDIATSALYLLAAPSTPDEARQEIIEAAQQGQKITYTQAKETIKGKRPVPTSLEARLQRATSPQTKIMPDDMRPHVEKYIKGYSDNHGRRFHEIDNPAHTNGRFWRDITATFKAHNIPYAEAGLKHVIKNLHTQTIDLVQECAATWHTWLQNQPGPKQPYLDRPLAHIAEWVPDRRFDNHTIFQARDILRAQLQANPLPPDDKYTDIRSLQNLLHLWLVYATGNRDIIHHLEWLADLKAQGKTGEYFTDTQNWMDTRATYRKNDLWQACNNHHDDLTQQLAPKTSPADPNPQPPDIDEGPRQQFIADRIHEANQANALQAAPLAQKINGDSDPDQRLTTLTQIRRQLTDIYASGMVEFLDPKDPFLVAIEDAIGRISRAIAHLKTKNQGESK